MPLPLTEGTLGPFDLGLGVHEALADAALVPLRVKLGTVEADTHPSH